MKKMLLMLLWCAHAAFGSAQTITHTFSNVPMPDVLKYIQSQSRQYQISFIYDELEDFRVTASVKDKRVPDAIMQLIGFYPLRMTVGADSDIYVECIPKAQQKYVGHLTDSRNRPIEFANVALLNPCDSTFITGGVTNSDGLFVIPCDERPVLVRCSYVGYQTLTVLSTAYRVGTLRMRESVSHLKEVRVTSIRPTITYRSDRYVIDVRNSMMAVGNTAESLLSQLPGVWVNGNRISINGISGVQVMINDRALKLSADQLMNYLKTIRSENIDRIEIMANPPAEFEAQGAGGVLRILTCERQGGMQLNVGSTVDFISYNALKPYFSFACSKGKFGADATVSGTFGKGYLRADELTQNRKSLVNYDNSETDRMNDVIYTIDTNLYYDFSKWSKIALNVNFYRWFKHEHVAGTTRIEGENAPQIRRTLTQHETVQNNKAFSASLNYTCLFGPSRQHKLLVMADAAQSHYPTRDEYAYRNEDAEASLISTERHYHLQHSPYLIFSGEARMQWDFKTDGTVTTGVKSSHSEKGNDLLSKTLTASGWTVNGQSGFDLNYSENLQAAYLKYELSRKRWSLSTGLRAEYDEAHAEGYKQQYHHFDFFPSLYYTLRVSPMHTVSVTAARRTLRVNFIRLLPYRYYGSRYTIMTGNPGLRPDYSNHLSLAYRIADKYELTLTHVWSNNGTDHYNHTETIGGQTLTVASYVDGVKERLTNLNAFLPVTICSWWSVVNQARACYDRYETAETDVRNFDWSAYTQHTVVLPHAVRMQLLYRFQSKSKSAYGWASAYHTLDVSWMKTFLKDRLTMKLAVSDLICGQKSSNFVHTGSISQQTAMYGRRSPFFSLSAFYNISRGKRRQHEQIERSNSEEKARAN